MDRRQWNALSIVLSMIAFGFNGALYYLSSDVFRFHLAVLWALWMIALLLMELVEGDDE